MDLKSQLWAMMVMVTATFVRAQSPQAFNYQTILRDTEGKVLSNQDVQLQVSIRQGTANGPAVYEENFADKTNGFGLLSEKIGRGNPVSGIFDQINWGNGPFFLEINIDAGTNLNTVTEILSVPYALFAEQANEQDGDPINEIQQLSLNGSQLTLSKGGGSVTLPNGQNYSAGAGITIAANQISAIDASPTNEIQSLTFDSTNQILSISSGNSVKIGGSTVSYWQKGGAVLFPKTNGDGVETRNGSGLKVVSAGVSGLDPVGGALRVHSGGDPVALLYSDELARRRDCGSWASSANASRTVVCGSSRLAPSAT